MNRIEPVEIRNSKVSGKGIFATRTLKPGEKIMPIQGKVLNLKQFFKASKKIKDNMFRFGDKEYLSPAGEHGDYANHSCNPNAKVVKKNGKLYLTAIKNIRKSQEILFDYTTVIAKDDYWTMKCECGYKECRKKILRYNKLPEKVLTKYIKNKIIPGYILKIKE